MVSPFMVALCRLCVVVAVVVAATLDRFFRSKNLFGKNCEMEGSKLRPLLDNVRNVFHTTTTYTEQGSNSQSAFCVLSEWPTHDWIVCSANVPVIYPVFCFRYRLR